MKLPQSWSGKPQKLIIIDRVLQDGTNTCNMTVCLKNTFVRGGSRLTQLFPELLRHIFEYDDTYKEHFQKNVLLDIWQRSWQNWHAGISCPYKHLVAEWLLTTWGVYGDSIWSGDSQEWFRKNYHHTDIVVMTRFVDNVNNDDSFFTYTDDSEEIVDEEENYKCMVQVYMKRGVTTSVIFAGEIFTRQQYTAHCQLENHYVDQIMDVHSNRETGLYLYQRTH